MADEKKDDRTAEETERMVFEYRYNSCASAHTLRLCWGCILASTT